jgi:hypothetical protein
LPKNECPYWIQGLPNLAMKRCEHSWVCLLGLDTVYGACLS